MSVFFLLAYMTRELLLNQLSSFQLMRRAYEIAFADASAFLKSRCPNLLSMDEVTFRRPVHVGSLLKLTSHIVYAEGYPHRSFQVCLIDLSDHQV